jgi:hypothetical protein
VQDPSEIECSVSAFAHEPNGGLIVAASAPAMKHRNLIIALALQCPAISCFALALPLLFGVPAIAAAQTQAEGSGSNAAGFAYATVTRPSA